MAAYYGFPALFVGLAAALILFAAIRRDWRGLLYATVFTGPAAVAWIAYARYEANRGYVVAEIGSDKWILVPALLAISLPAVFYALVRIIELVFGMGFFVFRLANRRETTTESLTIKTASRERK